MTRDWSEERIAALIDGSLEDEEEAASLRQALRDDPRAREFAERLSRSNALLRESFAISDDQPIPPRIAAAIFRDVETLSPRRAKSRGWFPAAVAACLALAVGFGIRDTLYEPDAPAVGATLRAGALYDALERLASGHSPARGVQVLLSFRDGAGRICREFEMLSGSTDGLERGIACRSGAGGWRVLIAAVLPDTQPGTKAYGTASGGTGDPFERMLEIIGAGPAIAPDEERSLLEGHWQTGR